MSRPPAPYWVKLPAIVRIPVPFEPGFVVPALMTFAWMVLVPDRVLPGSSCRVPAVIVPALPTLTLTCWSFTVPESIAIDPPLVAWSEEFTLLVEASDVRAESLSALPDPSAVNASAPPGLLATPLRLTTEPDSALMFVGW